MFREDGYHFPGMELKSKLTVGMLRADPYSYNGSIMPRGPSYIGSRIDMGYTWIMEICSAQAVLRLSLLMRRAAMRYSMASDFLDSLNSYQTPNPWWLLLMSGPHPVCLRCPRIMSAHAACSRKKELAES